MTTTPTDDTPKTPDGADPGTDPAPADQGKADNPSNPPDPPTPPKTPQGKTFSQADIDTAVGKVRARFGDHDALKTEVDTIKDGSHPIIESVRAETVDAERGKYLPQLHALAVENAAIRAGFIDPDDAVAAIAFPAGAVEVDKEAIAAGVKDLCEKKPYLVDPGRPPSPRDLGAGRGFSGLTTSDDPLDMIAADVDARK